MGIQKNVLFYPYFSMEIRLKKIIITLTLVFGFSYSAMAHNTKKEHHEVKKTIKKKTTADKKAGSSENTGKSSDVDSEVPTQEKEAVEKHTH